MTGRPHSGANRNDIHQIINEMMIQLENIAYVAMVNDQDRNFIPREINE